MVKLGLGVVAVAAVAAIVFGVTGGSGDKKQAGATTTAARINELFPPGGQWEVEV